MILNRTHLKEQEACYFVLTYYVTQKEEKFTQVGLSKGAFKDYI